MSSVRGDGLGGPQPVPTTASGARGGTATGRDLPEGRGFAPFRVRAGTDLGTGDGFESALMRYCATTTGDVVVDGADLRSIGGSGLRVLVGIERRLRPLGRRLILRSFDTSCREAFKRVGLGRCCDSRTDRRDPAWRSGTGPWDRARMGKSVDRLPVLPGATRVGRGPDARAGARRRAGENGVAGAPVTRIGLLRRWAGPGLWPHRTVGTFGPPRRTP